MYPKTPGWKKAGASKDAAKKVKQDAKQAMYDRITGVLSLYPSGLTTKEIIRILWQNAPHDKTDPDAYAEAFANFGDYVRPRVTELRKEKIKDTGTRRDGAEILVVKGYHFDECGQGALFA